MNRLTRISKFLKIVINRYRKLDTCFFTVPLVIKFTKIGRAGEAGYLSNKFGCDIPSIQPLTNLNP